MNKALILAGLLPLSAAAVFAQATPAPAAPTGIRSAADWRKDHPRRAEVNARLAKQDKRIRTEVAEGEMSKAKAARLHREDRKIRREERTMASMNGGHITKREQAVLNQQENAVSKQIGK